MILGFNKIFLPRIENGTKIHTMREDKNDRWKAGNIIHFATGVRTKLYNCFKIGRCIRTQKIEIKWFPSAILLYAKEAQITIDDRIISNQETWELAINYGFDRTSDFFELFNKDWKGKIIHWTDFKY